MSATTSGTSRTRERVVWQVTEPSFQRGARLLAHTARERFGPITAVVGIAKGGRMLAYAAGASLNVRAYLVTARYPVGGSVCHQGGSLVQVDVDDLAQQIPGGGLRGNVLLVDDVCSSADTLLAARAAIEPFMAEGGSIVTAVLCRMIGAKTDPDLWLWSVRDPVIFPWERAKTSPTAILPDTTGVSPQ
jgi:adenine/guanine phosphoribosyltransferase-like PRPP-binding protein